MKRAWIVAVLLVVPSLAAAQSVSIDLGAAARKRAIEARLRRGDGRRRLALTRRRAASKEREGERERAETL